MNACTAPCDATHDMGLNVQILPVRAREKLNKVITDFPTAKNVSSFHLRAGKVTAQRSFEDFR